MFEVPHRDSPGGPVVKNPPCNAGDMGSIAGWEPKIPYAVKQLSPRATTTDPVRHNWVGAWQRQIPHDAIKILHAVMKTWCSQTK